MLKQLFVFCLVTQFCLNSATFAQENKPTFDYQIGLESNYTYHRQIQSKKFGSDYGISINSLLMTISTWVPGDIETEFGLGLAIAKTYADQKSYILKFEPGIVWSYKATKLIKTEVGDFTVGAKYSRSHHRSSELIADRAFFGLISPIKFKIQEWSVPILYNIDLENYPMIKPYIGIQYSGLRLDMQTGWFHNEDDVMRSTKPIGIVVGAKTLEEFELFANLELHLIDQLSASLQFDYQF